MEYRKQLKIRAIQAAKEKGIYLTEAINEKLGEAITVNEPSEWAAPFYMSNAAISNNAYYTLPYSQTRMEDSQGDSVSEVDFKKMKLRFEVSVVFALK
jgi:uncharacterized protein YggE